MPLTVRPAAISWLASVSAAIWMYGAEAAWAGDGGDSLGTIQAIIGPPDGASGFCKLLNMNPCPQLPTVTQAILEAAALGLSPPEMVAAQNDIAAGSNVNAGNPAVVPQALFVPTPFPLDSTTSPKLSDLLKTLTPLAFISASNNNHNNNENNNNDKNNKQGIAAATQLYDSNADTFLYAVTASSIGFATSPGGTVPDRLFLFYEDLSRTDANPPRGQTFAKFLLPLTTLSSDVVTETPVSATLNFKVPATGNAPCSASTVVSALWPKGIAPDQIGVNCAVVFGPSPTSKERHAIFEVAIPLLVTGATGCSPTPCTPPPPNTDPAYFYSSLHTDPIAQKALPGPINIGLFTAFLLDDLGTVLPSGASIGIAPTAGPLGPPPTCTPTNKCTPPPSTLALCASLPQNGNGQALVPAVGAYYSIATTGEALLSAALPGVSTSVCPKL